MPTTLQLSALAVTIAAIRVIAMHLSGVCYVPSCDVFIDLFIEFVWVRLAFYVLFVIFEFVEG